MLLSPPSPLSSKRYIAPKVHQLSRKQESLPDEIFKFKQGSLHVTTIYAHHIHVARPCLIQARYFIIIYQSMLVTLMSILFFLGRRDKGGKQRVRILQFFLQKQKQCRKKKMPLIIYFWPTSNACRQAILNTF